MFERNAADGSLGFGWTHSFNHKLNFYGVEGGTVKAGWVGGSGSERRFGIVGQEEGYFVDVKAQFTPTLPQSAAAAAVAFQATGLFNRA